MAAFLFLMISFILNVCSAQQGSMSLSWKNCTYNANALGTIDNVTFSPENPPLGTNFTITGLGSTSIDLGYDAFYTLDVTAEGLDIGSITDNACNASYLDLDGDYGRIYYAGMPCPINKGVFKVSQIGWTNQNAPWFGGLTATATFNAYYKTPNQSIVCMKVLMTFNN